VQCSGADPTYEFTYVGFTYRHYNPYTNSHNISNCHIYTKSHPAVPDRNLRFCLALGRLYRYTRA